LIRRTHVNLIIKLIGIKRDILKAAAAEAFLSEKLKGRRVYIRHDAVKYDSDNHLLAYLYLENKTFINAHLLKQKLADVDDSIPFGLLEKFKDMRYGGGKSSEVAI